MSEFVTGKSEVDADPDGMRIPVKSGATVLNRYDGANAIILLYIESAAYQDSDDKQGASYAINQSMACGIIGQLIVAMRESGIPLSEVHAMVNDAMAAIHFVQRAN